MPEYRRKTLTDEQNARIDKFQKALPEKPVDIVGLCESFGLIVWRSELPEGISGMIRREGEVYAIYSNKKEPAVRRRFTYAHELAHYFLHEADIGDGISENVLFRSHLTNDKEIAANQIAAEILMPMDTLNQVAETRKYDVRELADKFGVSHSAMLLRLGIPSS